MKSKSWDALLLDCFSSSPDLPALASSGSAAGFMIPFGDTCIYHIDSNAITIQGDRSNNILSLVWYR